MDDFNHAKSAFLGKVTAEVSHDLQNVLAVIKESFGLLEDILAMNHSTMDSGLSEKMSRCISSVIKQVGRGVEITSNMNGFAHTTDAKEAQANVSEVLERLIFLAKRGFLNKGFNIDVEVHDNLFSIQTDLVILQVLIYNCIEYAGLFCSGGEARLMSQDRIIAIIQTNRNTACDEDNLHKENTWSRLIQFAKAISVEIERLDNNQGLCLYLE